MCVQLVYNCVQFIFAKFAIPNKSDLGGFKGVVYEILSKWAKEYYHHRCRTQMYYSTRVQAYVA